MFFKMRPSPRWRLTTLIRTHSNGNMWPDDTTVPEVVVKVGESHAQAIANRVIEWSRENRVQLNADKCKELRISFAKEQRVFDPVIIEGKEVELSTYLPTYLPTYLSIYQGSTISTASRAMPVRSKLTKFSLLTLQGVF